MGTREQKQILNELLDKYERSATFRGTNKVNQQFQLKPEELFPAYLDDAEYDYFVSLNEMIRKLEEKDWIILKEQRGRVNRIQLNVGKVDEISHFLGRMTRREQIRQLTVFLKDMEQKLKEQIPSEDALNHLTEVCCSYLQIQFDRLKNGRLPEFFDDSFTDYQDLWKCLLNLNEIKEEIFVRDFSVRLYRDSKRLEQLRGKILSLLYKYGDYPEKEMILDECGVIRNPSYVMIKGAIRLFPGGQELDLGKLQGDLAFSSGVISNLSSINVYGNRLITIENLTSFHRFFCDSQTVAIYLGGFHNKLKRDFLKRLFSENPTLSYYHFGDIDAGGFYIYEHLRRMTGIPFQTWKMDRETLETFADFGKKLTANDVRRLSVLDQAYRKGEFQNPEKKGILDVIRIMLEKGIKLEQEAIKAE